jgi:hypothetical protein
MGPVGFPETPLTLCQYAAWPLKMGPVGFPATPLTLCQYTARPLKMGPIVDLETSATNYQYTLRKIPEDLKSHMRLGGSVISLRMVDRCSDPILFLSVKTFDLLLPYVCLCIYFILSLKLSRYRQPLHVSLHFKFQAVTAITNVTTVRFVLQVPSSSIAR